MKKRIILNKHEGETPLEAVQRFRQKNEEYKNAKIGYAGRLDPMASGALLLLIEDENKKFSKYAKLDKEYQAELLFSFQTDSYDILGIPKKSNSKLDEEKIKKIKGVQKQQIPYFSSYRIKGKPLFWYALNKRKVKLPKTKVRINSIKISAISKISSAKLLNQIIKRIKRVRGEFRQKRIISKWKKLLSGKRENYAVAHLKIKCSSGTYIRSIANKLGATLMNLKRTKIGRFKYQNSLFFI